MSLTDDQMQEFKDTGFIVLKGFFDEAVMDRVSVLVDGLRDEQPDKNREAKYYEDKWASYAPNQADTARSEDSFRV